MDILLKLMILIPLLGFIISFFVKENKENLIVLVSKSTIVIHFITMMIFVLKWFNIQNPSVQSSHIVLYSYNDYEFFINLFFDRISAVFAFIGSVLFFIISTYCRSYLHREKGFKRFYSILLIFYFSYNVIVFSGNFETMFLGWEFLGITSFLLISYYRDRYIPVKNTLKIFSIYRIGDLGMLSTIWLNHILWHKNIDFSVLRNVDLVNSYQSHNYWLFVVICLTIILSAIVKSGIFPFSFWLPKAMEGPTPSSAIFYGSLSVHIGIFLMLRTHSLWENLFLIKIIIIVLGALTVFICSLISSTQSSVKGQIAYASLAQLGFVLIELGLGWVNISMIHILGNIFLRTYQILVTPSIISYRIKMQMYELLHHSEGIKIMKSKFLNSLYILSLKEWNLENLINTLLWKPIDRLSALFSKIKLSWLLICLAFSIAFAFVNEVSGLMLDISNLNIVFAFFSVVSVFRSNDKSTRFIEKWISLFVGQLFVGLAIFLNEDHTLIHVLIYLIGGMISFFVGLYCLMKIKKRYQDFKNTGGLIDQEKRIGNMFFLACLGLMGFPISTTFIGIDLMFYHIHVNQFLLVFFVSNSYVLTGISAIKIFTSIFYGRNQNQVFLRKSA